MAQQQVQPIYIMPEDSQRTTGRDAQRNNIMLAKLVAETVRTTLGPKGMDKMIVDSLGDVIVTNDGATILKEIQIEHPSAKMIVEIAKTQETEVGDGTTTAVVIAGELLKNAEELLDKKIHPTVIIRGYRLAQDKAQEVLQKIGMPVDITKKDILKKIAMTAMMGKCAEVSRDKLSDLTVEAVSQVIDENGDVSIDNIKIEKRVGAGSDDSILIRGILLDKEKVHSAMPVKIDNAKILLYNEAIELKETSTDAKIQINDPMQMQAFLDQEERMLQKIVDKVIKTGANVVFCQKGIDDMAQYFLAKAGIFAARRVKKSDLEKLAKATGANIITSLDDVKKDDFGFAGSVREEKIGDEDMIYVEKCKNPKAVTLLVRGGTEHLVQETKRAVDDSIGDLISALKLKKFVAGAGAPEIELSKEIKKFAKTLSGREQLSVNAYANALEIIPKTLAENAGMDPIDILTELKSLHEKGDTWAGVNVDTGKAMDALKKGVIEPLKVKTHAIRSATEVAVMILRIDDVILGSTKKENPMPRGGMDMGM